MPRMILAAIGLFHLANGLFMAADPGGWYFATPGVPQTGPMNHHFIVDIGLAFSASGAGLLFTFRAGRAAAAFVLAGAIRPALHAIFHIIEWLSHGVPPDLAAAAAEGLGVIVVGLLGLALAARQFAIEESSNVEIAFSSQDRPNGAGFRL